MPKQRIWLQPGANAAVLSELADAQGWSWFIDDPRTRFDPRRLGYKRDDGVIVGWEAYHEVAVQCVWIEGDDDAAVAAARETLAGKLPVWASADIVEAAADPDLRTRLQAVRTWTIASTIDERTEPKLPEALQALAVHDEAVARVTAIEMGYYAALGHKDAILAIAREQAGEDELLTDAWQHLAQSIANRSDETSP